MMKRLLYSINYYTLFEIIISKLKENEEINEQEQKIESHK